MLGALSVQSRKLLWCACSHLHETIKHLEGKTEKEARGFGPRTNIHQTKLACITHHEWYKCSTRHTTTATVLKGGGADKEAKAKPMPLFRTPAVKVERAWPGHTEISLEPLWWASLDLPRGSLGHIYHLTSTRCACQLPQDSILTGLAFILHQTLVVDT